MAGMFYSLKEVAEKLGKNEDEVRELVKSGRLREFRDGPNLLFKVDEVNSLMSDKDIASTSEEIEVPIEEQPELVEIGADAIESETEGEKTTPPEIESAEDEIGPMAIETEGEKAEAVKPESEDEELLLVPEEPGTSNEEIELSDADTAIVEEGIKVLGETDAADALHDMGDETFKGLGETPVSPSKEASLEEIEEDVSLDTFGSGSGLLDLSLQADDTSLGGILDEIYTPGGEGQAAAAARPGEGSAMEVAAEADQMLSEAQFPEPQLTAPIIAATAQARFEPEPDAISNAMGIMLFIPFLAVIYALVVTIAGLREVMPGILKSIQGLIWYIAIGLAVASIVIVGAGAMMGREKAPKQPKIKKEKPPKVKKAKKEK